VEHYEISAYGTARALAEQLGLTEVVRPLQESLDEKSTEDEKLTGIAQKAIPRIEVEATK
jgi:ferritin-like metal-binding protein YciE